MPTFWVMFDTSQYPMYYGDVHDLVAAPRGFIMRYQYRLNLLSNSAVGLASVNRPAKVLLAYVQKATPYIRTPKKSEPTDPSAPTVIIPTRLGRMLNIVKDGDRFYFDFMVEGYPKIDETVLGEIFKPLADADEIPWTKWVATSQDSGRLDQLAVGDDADNWLQLVRELGIQPIQFASDAFWRLRGPFSKAGRLVASRVAKVKEEGQIRRVQTEFTLLENRAWHFQLASFTPKNTPPDRPHFFAEAVSSDTDSVRIIGSGQYDLRHYDEVSVEYRAEPMTPFRSKAINIAVRTVPNTDGWPTGPRLEIRHTVRKSHIVSGLGVICGVIAISMLALGGSKLFENDVLNGVYLVIGGLLLSAAAKYFLTGKLEFGK